MSTAEGCSGSTLSPNQAVTQPPSDPTRVSKIRYLRLPAGGKGEEGGFHASMNMGRALAKARHIVG
jgi:hypothetical protein